MRSAIGKDDVVDEDDRALGHGGNNLAQDIDALVVGVAT